MIEQIRSIGVALVVIAGFAPLCHGGDAGIRTAGNAAEKRTSVIFSELRKDPLRLDAFLRRMPKGADLHNHLSGSVYAESYLAWAANDGLCLDPGTKSLQPPSLPPTSCRDKGWRQATEAMTDPLLYRQVIDAWSMRGFRPAVENGHDRFFDTFGRFGPAAKAHLGDMLAEAANRAAAEHVSYLELMITADKGMSSEIGKRTGWSDPETTRRKLIAAGIFQAVSTARRTLVEEERKAAAAMHCGTTAATPGCKVTLAYICQISRNSPLGQVFGQLLAAFETARVEPRVVGLTLVQAEDGAAAMANFPIHMGMLDYLHRLYPEVHITLHAGELAPGLVPPEGLRFHVRESIRTGHAERIGHGVDVMYEDNPEELLAEMARKGTMVEICLTSNDTILGIKGSRHPLSLLLAAGVPVALASDDAGVSRTSLSDEYRKAVEEQGLAYPQLKEMARTSLQHAFRAGRGLWKSVRGTATVDECRADTPGAGEPTAGCRDFLRNSAKAQLQWQLEREFHEFERSF
jgi:adenosine deaminase